MLSKIALKVAHDCATQRDRVRIVFASRHGELRRTTDILRAIDAGESVSPTAFSLSVMNAMTGVFGIARGDRSPASAISAGAETLGYALLEAHAQYASDPSSPVLVVYADEPTDAAWGPVEDEVQGGALAILLDAGGVGDPRNGHARMRSVWHGGCRCARASIDPKLSHAKRGIAALPRHGRSGRIVMHTRQLAMELA